MPVTPATLIAEHPVFTSVPVALITRKIATATAMIDTTVMPSTIIDEAITLLACSKLAHDPESRPLMLTRMDGRSSYDDELDQLLAVHGTAYRLEGV